MVAKRRFLSFATLRTTLRGSGACQTTDCLRLLVPHPSIISIFQRICIRFGMFQFSKKFGPYRMKKNSLPFGGVQLVLCGDFFQLPPVGVKKGAPRFCFEASAWDAAVEESVVLKEVLLE